MSELPVSSAADTSPAGILGVDFEVLDGIAVLHVRGEIDLASAGSLRAEISARLASGDDLVVDCTEVTFLDSTGLSAFVAAQDHAERRGVRLVVVGSHRAVLRPLQVTCLDAVLTLAATLTDALARLGPHRETASPPPSP